MPSVFKGFGEISKYSALFIYFFSLFIYFERQWERSRERGRERERGRIPSRLRTVSIESDERLEPVNHEIMT